MEAIVLYSQLQYYLGFPPESSVFCNSITRHQFLLNFSTSRARTPSMTFHFPPFSTFSFIRKFIRNMTTKNRKLNRKCIWFFSLFILHESLKPLLTLTPFILSLLQKRTWWLELKLPSQKCLPFLPHTACGRRHSSVGVSHCVDTRNSIGGTEVENGPSLLFSLRP